MEEKIEKIDVYNKEKEITGKVVLREKGLYLSKGEFIISITAWIVNKEGKILMTQRKLDKVKGGMWEPTTGLVTSGETSKQGALRELKEELGYDAKTEELIDCGMRQFEFQKIFHNQLFHDHQISRIYALWLDQEPEMFTLQKEEVSKVKWFDFDECFYLVKNNLIPHCIYLEELEMVKKKVA